MMKIKWTTRRKARSLVSPALLCHVPHHLVIESGTTVSVTSKDCKRGLGVAGTGREELEKQFMGTPLELTLGLFLASPPLSPQ